MNDRMQNAGWFTWTIDSEMSRRGYGDVGQIVVLDQGNEVPEELMGMGPWSNERDAEEAAGKVLEGRRVQRRGAGEVLRRA
jgi:hypothetical protein